MTRTFVFLMISSSACLVLSQFYIQTPPSVTVDRGGSVRLSCYIRREASVSTLTWIKQEPGNPPRPIGSWENNADSLQDEFKNSSRFAIERSGDDFDLKISSTERSDVGRYFCAAAQSRSVRFGQGTVIQMKDLDPESISRRAVQPPVSVPVQPGDNVTLQCVIDYYTCKAEHSVDWFRHRSGESLSGLKTHNNWIDQCERSSELQFSTAGCVCSLTKTNLSSSDAGTYYCAVATSGQILFGNGTRLDIAGDRSEAGGSAESPCGCGGHSALSLSVLALAAVLCVFGTLVTALLCRRHRAEAASGRPPHSDQHCSPAHGTDTESQRREKYVLTYAALDFEQNKGKSGRKKRRNDSELSSDYAAVRTQQRR